MDDAVPVSIQTAQYLLVCRASEARIVFGSYGATLPNIFHLLLVVAGEDLEGAAALRIFREGVHQSLIVGLRLRNKSGGREERQRK